MKPGFKKGKLIKWNDDRGFGFVKPSEGGKEVFLHISAVKTTGYRPKLGDTIFYKLSNGIDGRIRATNALVQGVVFQSETIQRIKPALAKQKIKKRGLLETILSIFGVATIGLFYIQFGLSRSPTPITKPGCVVKGNISIATGNKLYHIPGMEDYDETIIDSAKGERWFCSESEAVAAGWLRAPR